MSLEAAKTLKNDKTQATGADGLNDVLVLRWTACKNIGEIEALKLGN